MPTTTGRSEATSDLPLSELSSEDVERKYLSLAKMREYSILFLGLFAVSASLYVAITKIPNPRVEVPTISGSDEHILSRALLARFLELPATRARGTVTTSDLSRFLEPFVRQGLIGRDSAGEAASQVMNGLREIGVDAAHQLLERGLRERTLPPSGQITNSLQGTPVSLNCAPRIEVAARSTVPRQPPARLHGARPRLCPDRVVSSQQVPAARTVP
jgi:hypothetical protein